MRPSEPRKRTVLLALSHSFPRTQAHLLQLTEFSFKPIEYWSGFADDCRSKTLKCSANARIKNFNSLLKHWGFVPVFGTVSLSVRELHPGQWDLPVERGVGGVVCRSARFVMKPHKTLAYYPGCLDKKQGTTRRGASAKRPANRLGNPQLVTQITEVLTRLQKNVTVEWI
jgi:hypothetical protein